LFSLFFKKSFYIALILMPLALSFSAGCQSANSARVDDAAQVEVTDNLGRKIKIPAKIERVVSLAPSVTENIFAVGAGDKLVGVTTYCNYPVEAQQKPKIGDTLNPNLETVIAAKPQLVLASTDSQLEVFTRKLEEQNIPVYVTDAKDVEAVLRNLRGIGELLGAKETAEKQIADLQARLAVINSKIQGKNPVKVFVQISPEPLFTVGKASFITDLVKRAGGVSVTADVPDAYPKISKETALAAQPEAIILSFDEGMGAANGEPAAVFKDSPAVKNNRVYKINGEWLARPSPRLVDALKAMAKALHPDLFENQKS
jgi:iron complex transport system substrate-binding protein